MKIIGDLNKSKIMLIHGAGFHWNNCFREVIRSLKDDHCIIIPFLPGHCDERKELMESVEKTSIDITKQLFRENIKEIDIVYGISLGASVALEIALNNAITIRKIVLDGGQYVSMGEQAEFFSGIMSKQFMNLLKGEHLQKEIRDNMGYKDNDIEILKPMLYEYITEEVLYSAFMAAYNYDITTRDKKLSVPKVLVIFGSKEIYAKNSCSILKPLISNEFSIKEIDNMGHSEALSLHPDFIVDILKE